MKLFDLKKAKPLVNHLYSNGLRQYTTDFFPYTNELYKKKYIRYPVQSRMGIQHDYLYSGSERLPTLAERLKGSHLILIWILYSKSNYESFVF